MSLDNFISYLQQLLTMIDKDDAYSVALGKQALLSIIALARISGKADAMTMHCMISAEHEFDYLVQNAQDFVGKPGQYLENKQRRRRLRLALLPSC